MKRIISLVLILILISYLHIPMSSFGADIDECNYIVELKDDVSLFSINNRYNFYVVSKSDLDELLEMGIVEDYEIDAPVELFDVDASYDYTYKKWNYEHINAYKAEKIGCYGQNVKIGVIDSGVHAHADIADNILDGYNFLDDNTDVTDNIGHGTFVSGLIAAKSTEDGISGVAKGVEMVPLKCFDPGVQTSISTISKAIYDAVDIFDCDIINMSLGSTAKSSTLKNAVDYAVGKGAIIVAAVGNKGTNVSFYPAAYDNVIGVGSVDINNEKSWFSQYNSSVFITAPGEDVWSTSIEDTYWLNEGTSFSTPLVAACIAVMMNIDEDISFAEICDNLKNSSTDLGTKGYDTNYGYGLLNVEGCIDLMLDSTDYFISPVITTDNKSEVFLYNNTVSELCASLVFSNYSEGRYMGLEYKETCVDAGEALKLSCAFTENDIKCFLWKNLDSMNVLSESNDNIK